MRAATVILLLLVTGVAGCVSTQAPKCTGASCDAPTPTPTQAAMITREPGVPFPPIPADVTQRSAKYEDCTGLAAGLYVPYVLVRAAVPKDFDILVFPEGMGIVFMEAERCKRLVLGERVIANYTQLTFAVEVFLKNESWAPVSGASRYLLEMFPGDEEVAKKYASLGIPAKAATIHASDADVLQQAVTSWEIASGATTFAFDYHHPGGDGGGGNVTSYLWIGDRTYFRLNVDIDYAYESGNVGGVVRMAGPSKVASMVKSSPVIDWEGHPTPRLAESLLVDEEIFKGDG